MPTATLLTAEDAYKAGAKDFQLAYHRASQRCTASFMDDNYEEVFQRTVAEEWDKLVFARVERGELEPFDKGII